MKGWLEDWQLEKEYYWNEFRKLLSGDRVLMIVRAQLIGPSRVPRSTHVSHSNISDAIRNLMQLLQDAGFTAGSFEAHAILERDLLEVITAYRYLRAKLTKLDSNCDPATRVIKTINDDLIE